jgi:xanthine dehydrogenase molybdopterin-binding subunit B
VGNAVLRAATDAREQVVQLAADRLEANPVDLMCCDGRIFVQGSPDRGFALGKLARYAQTRGSGPILGHGAFASRVPQSLHSFGTQIVEVEVDEETGEVALIRIIAAHDVRIGKTKGIFALAPVGAHPLEHPSAIRWRTLLAWGVHARRARGSSALRSTPAHGWA